MVRRRSIMARVFVGMSGGVDSSVAAALLQRDGHDVVGVYMKNWTEDLPGMHCPWADDLADAKRVAVKLGIDLRVYDFQAEYKHKVVEYMIAEYEAGRTPNPDILCNQEVKFKLFLETALADGAEMIATGHYARVGRSSELPVATPSTVSARQHKSAAASLQSAELAALKQSSTGQDTAADLPGLAKVPGMTTGSSLHMAKDANKDQTYFLYRVTSQALAKTLFPLGDFASKAEVRKKAEEFGLATAHKKDSQGICFVGKVGIRDFLSQYVQTQPGAIIDTDAQQKIGQHDGAIFYTLGQRHGLDVGGGLPYYVVGKDMAKNEVYVSRNLDAAPLWRQQVQLNDLHAIAGGQLAEGDYMVRIRHRAPLVAATLRGNTLTFSEPQRAVASGQSAVLYQGDECVGGAVIGS